MQHMETIKWRFFWWRDLEDIVSDREEYMTKPEVKRELKKELEWKGPKVSVENWGGARLCRDFR